MWSVFCSNCGRESKESERFCADCGNRLESKPIAQSSKQAKSESSSFENLIAERVREARRNSAPVITYSSGSRSLQESQRQSESLGEAMSSKGEKSPFLFSRVTFVTGLLAMIVGYLILPFAYVIDSYEGYSRQFDWRLPTIASLLGDRSDENYVFGPALSFLVGGYLWTLVVASLITLVALLTTRQIDKAKADLSDNRGDQIKFAVLLGRSSLIMMSLLFTWQITGMWTLQRAADIEGGLTGGNGYYYFSLGFGSVLSLLGIVVFAFAGATMTNRAIVERNR